MPRYFIDVTDGTRELHDKSGSNASLPEAKAEAVAALVDLFRQGLDSVGTRTASARVRTVAGLLLYEATLTFHAQNHRQDHV